MKYSPFYFHIQNKRMRIQCKKLLMGSSFTILGQRCFRAPPIHSFSQPIFTEHIHCSKLLVIKFHFQPSQNLQSSEGQGKSSKQINISVISINATKETHRLQRVKVEIYILKERNLSKELYLKLKLKI